MLDPQQRKEITAMIQEEIKNQDTDSSFRERRTIDTPTDSYSIVNRRYLTLNGDVADRPRSSVATLGQPYFASDTVIPMVFTGTNWINGVGSVVAQGRN